MTVAEIRRTTEVLREHLVPAVRATDLARAAGVSRQYVYDVLRGHRPPSAKLLAAARELGIPVDVPLERARLSSRKSASPASRAQGSRDNDRGSG
jgi:transcriptional regulator with XRE-family HTH domain